MRSYLRYLAELWVLLFVRFSSEVHFHTVLVHQYQTGSYFVAEPGEPIFVPSIYSSKRNSGSVGVSRYQAFSFIPQRRVHDQCDGPKLRVGPSSPRADITGVNSCSSFNLVQSGRYVKSLA